MTSNVARPKLGSIAYGGVGIDDCSEPGVIALTFDDGPYIYTQSIVDQLTAAGQRATFFQNGSSISLAGRRS